MNKNINLILTMINIYYIINMYPNVFIPCLIFSHDEHVFLRYTSTMGPACVPVDYTHICGHIRNYAEMILYATCFERPVCWASGAVT